MFTTEWPDMVLLLMVTSKGPLTTNPQFDPVTGAASPFLVSPIIFPNIVTPVAV